MDFTTLKSKVGDWLGKDTDSLPDSALGDMINMAIREYLRTLDLRFGEKTLSNFAMTAATPYTALPSDFSRPYSIWYLDSNSAKVDVDYLSKEEFDIKYYDSSETGDPEHYTIWGNKVLWGPTPSTTRNSYFNYYGYLTDLSAPTDHNDFTDLAWELIFFRSLGFATLYGIEDGRMVVWEKEAARQEIKVITEHSRKTAGRRPAARDYGYTGK